MGVSEIFYFWVVFLLKYNITKFGKSNVISHIPWVQVLLESCTKDDKDWVLWASGYLIYNNNSFVKRFIHTTQKSHEKNTKYCTCIIKSQLILKSPRNSKAQGAHAHEVAIV